MGRLPSCRSPEPRGAGGGEGGREGGGGQREVRPHRRESVLEGGVVEYMGEPGGSGTGEA